MKQKRNFSLIREFGKDKKNRDLMAQAARRALARGDDSVYHDAYDSLVRGGANKEELADYGKSFEDFNEQPTNNLTGENKIMKGQIKLTEEQLHQVIKEAVNKLLTELDWRTYANAAKKASERGDDELANDFKRHLTFNSSMGEYETPTGGKSRASVVMNNDGSAMPVGSIMHRDGQRIQVSGFGDENGKYDTFHSTYGDKYRKDPSYLGSRAANRYKELERQANDYNNGKSQYIKGKGW